MGLSKSGSTHSDRLGNKRSYCPVEMFGTAGLLQRGDDAWLVVDEQIRNELRHTVGCAARSQLDEHLIAVDGHRRHATAGKQQTSKQVRRAGPLRRFERRVALVTHTGQGSIGLEANNAATRTRLLGDGNQLTHETTSLRSTLVSDHVNGQDPTSSTTDPTTDPATNSDAPIVTLSLSETGNLTVTDTSDEVHGWRVSRLTENVPIATIITTIALVLATFLVLTILSRTSRIITWILVAAFFAVVLTPPVNWLKRRFHLRPALAASLVFILGLATIGGLAYLFIRPLAEQGTEFANNLPEYVADAKNGQGPAGKLVKRYKLDDWLDKNSDEIQSRAEKIFEPNKVLGVAVGTVGAVFSTIAAVLTIAVLTFLMLLEGHHLLMTTIRVLHPDAQFRLQRVGRLCARAINGYVNGNLAISAIAGLTTWIFLLSVRVPFAGVLALWVAFADLIPLVGATLGAIPTIAVAFLHSTTAGIATTVFYVIYQQIENQVLQPTIMARTVAMQPLVILISVLIGVELFGLLGALLAIPIAGIIKVIGADILAYRRPDLMPIEGRMKKRKRSRRNA